MLASSALLVLWSCLAARPVAHAQDLPELSANFPEVSTCPASLSADGQPPEGYDTAIRDAVVDHDAGRFAEARAQFLRAHQIFPNARTLRGLGMVEFELRNYPACVRYLEAALACNVRPLEKELASESERLLARARAYVGEVKLHIRPENAVIDLDGSAVARAPEAALLLGIGTHELRVHASNHVTDVRSVSIVGGDQPTLDISLTRESLLAATTTPAAPAAPLAPHTEHRPLLKQWWLWTIVGAVVAAGVTTSVLLATRDRADHGDGVVRTPQQVGGVVMTLERSP
jgi:hypothetical protein